MGVIQKIIIYDLAIPEMAKMCEMTAEDLIALAKSKMKTR